MPSNLMAIEFFERFASWLPSSYAREDGYSSNLTQLRFAASIAPGRVHREMRCIRLIATRRSGAPIHNQLIEDELARYFAAGVLSRAENSTHLDRSDSCGLASGGSRCGRLDWFRCRRAYKRVCKQLVLQGKF
jgi:hypothetical protein